MDARGFVIKIWHIILGNFRRLFKRKQNLFLERYRICKKCDQLVKDNLIGDYCNHCGCPISSKSRVKDEECELGKWPINDYDYVETI